MGNCILSGQSLWLMALIVPFVECILMIFRMMSDYTVETINDGLNEFNVEFHGPKDSNALFLILMPLIYVDFPSLIIFVPQCK